MNKKYIKPEATVIEINTENQLLAVSGEPNTVYEETSTSPDLSKGHNSFNIWGSDEED